MTSSENVKEIEEKILFQQSENTRAINSMKKQVQVAQEELLELTKMNTKLLESIASLTAEQYGLESELGKSTNVLNVADDGPAVAKETEERNRLLT